MGLMDKIKGMFGGATEKASEMAEKAGDKLDKTPVGGMVDKVAEKAGEARHTVGGAVEGAVDKVADKADAATKGKYTDKIDKVRDVADKLDGEDDTPAADTPAAGAAESDPPATGV
jgi:hypothetical protein